jgi:hypothetical protein
MERHLHKSTKTENFNRHRAAGIFPSRFSSVRAVFLTFAITAGAASNEPPIILTQIDAQHYSTEHCLFLIPDSQEVSWPDYHSVYSDDNVATYVASLKSLFPDDYRTIGILANNLAPNLVPRLVFSAPGENFVYYNIGGGFVNKGAIAIFDHEFGHNFGPIATALLSGVHWSPFVSFNCQMKGNFSDDGFQTVITISGNPIESFTWSRIGNLVRNETTTYSKQLFHRIGITPVFPTSYLIENPVFDPDGSVTYSDIVTVTHEGLGQTYFSQVPDYRNSGKRFRIAFIYVAQDANEIQTVHSNIESSIRFFTYSESIDTDDYRFLVPMDVLTESRASVDSRLYAEAGNVVPTITLNTNYIASPNVFGKLNVDYSIANDAAEPFSVYLRPDLENSKITADKIEFSNLEPGTHFFSVVAVDDHGYKDIEHLVVDVIGGPKVVEFKPFENPPKLRLRRNFLTDIEAIEVSTDLESWQDLAILDKIEEENLTTYYIDRIFTGATGFIRFRYIQPAEN